MSAFGGLILTNKGRNLQAKAQAGATLNFTRIAVGDGDLAGSSILDLNALKHQVKSLIITKFKSLGSGKAVVGGVLSNQDLVSGFYWRELGVFAQDPDLGEILYCYGNSAANAEYIPAGGGPDIVEKSIDVITLVGNAASVTATIESSLVYATAQELTELAGAGRTTETVKGVADAQAAHEDAVDPHSQYALDSDLAALAGAGNTTTVKALADAQAEHLAENATEADPGHIEIATQAEVTAGTDTTRAVVPKYLKTELGKKANNKNLLINWDFRNPVNQRGASSYPTNGFTIDQWQTYNNAVVTLTDGAISNINYSGSTQYANLFTQYLANAKQLRGKTVTVTLEAEVSSGSIAIVIHDGTAHNGNALTLNGTSKVTYTISESAPDVYVYIINMAATSTSFKPIRIKLEIGSASTLVDDPPANYKDQLALCGSLVSTASPTNYLGLDGQWQVY